MKKYSVSLIIRELQIRTLMRCITAHRSEWPSSENLHIINAGQDVEKREPSCTQQECKSWEWKLIQPLRRTVWRNLLKSESESHSVVSDFATPWQYSPWNSLGQNTGMGNLSLLQQIFPTQELNQGLSPALQADSLPAELYLGSPLGIKPPYEPAVLLLVTEPEKTAIEKDTCTPIFIAALFTIARTWKQPRCPSIDEWIKVWYIYTVEYFSAMKRTHLSQFW